MGARRLVRVWLCLLFLLAALAPATAQEIKLATWNLEWLTTRDAGDPALPPDVTPKRPEDIAALRAVAGRLDADVIAIEEVDGAQVAAAVFAPERYAVYMTGDRVVQRVGFAVRRDWHVIAHPDLTALDPYPPQARAHLRSGADITLDLPGGQLRLLALHLKAGCHSDRLAESRRPACHVLQAQARVLESWIAARARADEAFVVIGDFNRRAEGDDDFAAALAEAAPLTEATAGHASPCWGGEPFIDRVFLGGAAQRWLAPDSLRVLVDHGADRQTKRLSDHCPVSVRLRVGEGS
ncbi:MAG: endonuclease/exonuclease/phosphatase family protein [Acidibrevibacterium sp.]|jgi:endonuclease/exonuclease/phosphatase family metal-dependent hydrolase|uniref:endonuclease/exonuclease/phosphatase family protein n=1 Tax=Acidibrevibacterium fodinaquatile TaxID=1969806 RepID=UPI0023A802CF|nr:endonuclease/exonuclease/phosphatase family protein [Acidibrevibacterium fodinaquatile]MCA7118023.1 endonuclease/exonuclease/phosphatase family protein [Acidibrevibacterium fodinaquatile]